MPKHCAELFSALSSNLDFVLVAVIIGHVKGGQALVPNQAPEEGDGTLGLDVIPAEG